MKKCGVVTSSREPIKLFRLQADLINLVSQTQPTLNTYLFKVLAKKYKVEGELRKKLSDKIRYAVKKLCKQGILKIDRISPRLYQVELTDGRLLDLIGYRTMPETSRRSLHSVKEARKGSDFWQLSAKALAPRYSRQHRIWSEAAYRYWLKRKLTKEEREELRELFDDWKFDVSCRVLVFEDPNGELVFFGYKTRFTSKAEALNILKRAEEAFSNAVKQYDEAVFITITLPPIFPLKLSLYALSFIFHRIKAFLRKQHKETLPHFKVIEPQQTFNPHIHAVVFGTSFIMEKRKFTRWLDKQLQNFLSNLGNHYKKTINKRATEEHVNALNKLGKRLLHKYKRYKRNNPRYEGLVNWLTAIRIENENAVFENPPPDYQKTYASVWDYIKFYIVGAIAEATADSSPGISLGRKKKQLQITFYWLFRLQFWFASRSIRPKIEKPPPSGCVFKGSYYVWQLEALCLI